MRASLVLTTINDPVVIQGYRENFDKFNHDVKIYVIPDLDTPPSAVETCKKYRAEFIDFTEQENFLGKLGFSIPWHSGGRRNIGYLKAYEDGCDFMISIDDDNYALGEDVFKEHSVVCDPPKLQNVFHGGWYNILKSAEVYARGFPYHVRGIQPRVSDSREISIPVNEGLWIGAPDVDAMTWLIRPTEIDESDSNSVVLAGTWSPINTQNTAIRSDLIPAFYFPEFGRFSDIFAGYFLETCVFSQGEGVRFGTPIAHHRRNTHNYLLDAAEEMPCILMNEKLTKLLVGAKIKASSYIEAYLELAHLLDESNFYQFPIQMQKWIEVCKVLR